MNLLAGLKSYLWAGIAAAFGLLLTWLKIKDVQYENAKAKRDQYKAESERQLGYLEDAKKIDEQFKSHRADLVREIKETGTSSELEDPNKW
jgi:hypothetical protein